MSFLSFYESPPPAALAAIAECVWRIEVVKDGARHWVLPDGCAHLSVRRFRGHATVSFRLPETRALQAPAQAGETFTGVRFRPGAHRAIRLSDAQRLVRAGMDLEHAVASSLQNAPDGRLTRFVELAANRSIAAGAEEVGLTERQVERLVLAGTGMTPKALARLLRLQRAVRCIAGERRSDLACIAAESGFADQSHMGREFVALGNLTPGGYLRLSEQTNFHLL